MEAAGELLSAFGNPFRVLAASTVSSDFCHHFGSILGFPAAEGKPTIGTKWPRARKLKSHIHGLAALLCGWLPALPPCCLACLCGLACLCCLCCLACLACLGTCCLAALPALPALLHAPLLHAPLLPCCLVALLPCCYGLAVLLSRCLALDLW